jgi:signal transduction histidine kinase
MKPMRGNERTGQTRGKRKGFLSAPWLWTLGVSASLAAIVAIAGSMLSRQSERFSDRPPGNRVDDSFRQTARHIGEMEELWEKALDEEAARLLKDGLHMPPDGSVIVGVEQRSLLAAGNSDQTRAHLRGDGKPPEWRPLLERFAKKEPGEWVLTEAQVLDGSGWIEMPGKPLAWWHGGGRSAVVLLVDPLKAAKVVEEDLAARMKTLDWSAEPGALSWSGPEGRPWLTGGNATSEGKPDEILRHVSRFGDWTLRRTFPVRVETTYRPPVLAGSFTLAALLLSGGVAVASWQRKAIRVAEERVSFVNRVSHELRTPLTNLLLNTDLAMDGLPVEDGKVRRRLGLIREETARLSRIVDNVLAFARIERGNDEPRPAACDVSRLLGELKESFAPLFERKSIVCEYDESLAGDVTLDRDSFSQILSNLLSNVEKYAGEGSRARLSLTAEGGYLIAEVEDNGPGIPSEARKRVFLPFERAGSRVDEGATGTGLGLAISRELAERMGGRLELIPAAKGARFRLMLPLVERSRA